MVIPKSVRWLPKTRPRYAKEAASVPRKENRDRNLRQEAHQYVEQTLGWARPALTRDGRADYGGRRRQRDELTPAKAAVVNRRDNRKRDNAGVATLTRPSPFPFGVSMFALSPDMERLPPGSLL